jgi:hypothetical protein
MSTTTAPPPTPTDKAVSAARGFAQLTTTLETNNPALASQLTGSLATYAKSGIAPIVGGVLGLAVAHYGLSCATPPAPGCWTPDLINQVSEAIALVCAGGASLIMHWVGKAPTRAAIAASTSAPPAAA